MFGEWDFHWNGIKQMLLQFIKKKLFANYRSISSLPICEKIFGRLLYDIFIFFITNHVISTNQSDSKPRFLHQSTLINYPWNLCVVWWEIWLLTCIFYQIKGFDNIWHKGFNFSLKQNGISAKTLRVMKNFVIDRKEHVVLIRQCSIA